MSHSSQQNKDSVKETQTKENGYKTRKLVDHSYLLKRTSFIPSKLHTITSSLSAFKANGQGFDFIYVDYTGKPISYKHKREKGTLDGAGNDANYVWRPYKRTRLHPDYVAFRKQNKQTDNKYTQPSKSGVHPYFTALYQCFINPSTKIHSSNFEEVVMVEGELKAWSLCLLGVPAIGLSGIFGGTVVLDKNGNRRGGKEEVFVGVDASFYQPIKDFVKEFKPNKIIQLHDSDATVNIGNLKRAKSFSKSVFYFSKACEEIGVEHDYTFGVSSTFKGIDDLILESGEDVGAIIKELMTSTNTSSNIGQFFSRYQVRNSYNLASIRGLFLRSINKTTKVNKYLFENVVELEEVLVEQLEAKVKARKTIGIFAPTGTGKNDTLIYLAVKRLKKKHPKLKVFFCYPSNISVEAKTKEYSNPKLNYHKLGLNIVSVDQYMDSLERERLEELVEGADIVNFCAKSWGWIEPLIDQNCILFRDEIHKGTTQSGIAPLSEYQQMTDSEAVVVDMTGTPFESYINEFDVRPFYYSRVVSPVVNISCIELGDKRAIEIKKIKLSKKIENLKKRLEKSQNDKGKLEERLERLQTKYLECATYQHFGLKCKNRLCHLAARNLIDTINTKEIKVHNFYINDVEASKELGVYAVSKGFDIDFIDSKNKDGKAWQALTTGQPIKLNDKPLIVFNTCLGYESLNLNNDPNEIGLIAVFGEEFVENLRQLIGRARKALELNVLYFIGRKDKSSGFYKSYKQFKEEVMVDSGFLKRLVKMDLSNYTSSTDEKRIVNTLTRYFNNDGELNSWKLQAGYETKKALRETNKQKFERIAEHFTEVDVLQCDVSSLHEIAHIWNDTFKEEEPVMEVVEELVVGAVKNEEEVLVFEEEVKVERKEIVEAVKTLVGINFYYFLGLVIDRKVFGRLKTDFRVKIEKLISKKDIHKEIDYNQFKADHWELIKLIATSRKGERYVKKLVSQIIHLGETYHIEAVVELVLEGKYKKVLEELDTAKLLNENRGSFKDVANGFVYDAIVKEFELGKVYSYEEIKEVFTSGYNIFKHIEPTEKSFIKQIKRMFEFEEVRTASIKQIKLIKMISVEAVEFRYNLRKMTVILV